jgi:hypothetical protein
MWLLNKGKETIEKFKTRIKDMAKNFKSMASKSSVTNFSRKTIEKNIEQTAPGNYRVRVYSNHKRHEINTTSLTKARRYRKQMLSGNFSTTL